jgi:hypothetical protein
MKNSDNSAPETRARFQRKKDEGSESKKEEGRIKKGEVNGD